MSPGADPYRLSRRSTYTLVGLFLAIAAAAVLSIVGLPYVVRQPGPIANTLGNLDGKPLITVRGAETYPTTGALNFTTDQRPRRPAATASTSGSSSTPGSTPAARSSSATSSTRRGSPASRWRRRAPREMVDSQQEAIAVALRAAGQDRHRAGQHRGQVAKDAPSASEPEAGRRDRRRRRPGDHQRRRRARRHQQAQAGGDGGPAAAARRLPGRRGRDHRGPRTAGRRIGVFLARDFDFPVDVQIHAGDVGGPSAGMMFALGIYDR